MVADQPVAPAPAPRRSRAVAVQAVAIVLLLVAGLARVSTVHGRTRTLVLEPSLVAAAPAAARAQRTAKGELTITVRGPGGTVVEHGDAAMDLEHALSTVSMDLGAAKVPGGPQELRMVSRGNHVWIRVPDERLAANHGRHWVAVDTLSGAVPDATTDPAATLDRLTLAGGEPTVVGREDVRGVPTVRYHFDVPVENLVKNLPDRARRQTLAALGQAGVTSVGTDAWIDRGGLPRRMESGLDMQGLSFTMRFELFDYGAPVTVVLPADSDSTDVPTLAAAFAALGMPAAGLPG